MMLTGSVTAAEAVSEDMWVPTLCWTCRMAPCMIRVHRVNGVATDVEGNIQGEGFSQISRNQGRICPKPYGLIQKLYNPFRIKAPLRRTNPQKGRGVDPKWVEISWDEALGIVAEELGKIRAADSNRLCFAGAGPEGPSLMGTWSAFLKAFGTMTELQGGPAVRCDFAEHIFGNIIHGGMLCQPDLAYCNYLLLFGVNPAASNGVGENILFTDARARGMKIVEINPVLTAIKADEWLPIRPGTDTAFLLALINVIIHELGVYDDKYLKGMTDSPYLVGPDGYFVRDEATNRVLVWDPVTGKAKAYDDVTIKDFALEGNYRVRGIESRPVFQILKNHVEEYTPEWASTITEIAPDVIRRIAREWVDNARIGSTIEIEGVTLPYRPVAIKMCRGITGQMRCYQFALANHILAALVGALETVGGHCGGRMKMGGAPWSRGIIPGLDGMTKPDTHAFAWPPISYDGAETLIPYSREYLAEYHAVQLGYRNIADPPDDFPIPPLPEAYLRYHCNPLVSVGEPEVVSEALRRIPFLVSIAYVMDEVTELADIVLPDHIDLERFELCTILSEAYAKKFSGIMLRQPVVEPLYNTKDIADIFTELADRIGFLDEYNMAVNDILLLTDPHKLEARKKYAWVDIVDRHCKSATKGAHDLEWFKEHGAILRRVPVEEQYEIYLEMREKRLRHPIPYMEHVKKTGEELARNLARVGIDWWPTSEYVPLPIYVPSILEEVPTEYDFYVTVSRSPLFGWGSNTDIPWMIEIAEHMRTPVDILMNAKAAKIRGIRDGDEIWVESEVGKVKRRVKLCNGIRPDTLVIAGMFGHWATPIAKDGGRVSQTTLVPMRRSWTDPLTGTMQGNTVKAKVYKV